METKRIQISGLENGLTEALSLTEQIGESCGLTHKENIRLRLLAEELTGIFRGITGKLNAEYWMSYEGKKFELHLSADVILNQEMRRQFLDISSSGKNAAAKGFMGKLREVIAVALLPESDTVSLLRDINAGMISTGGVSVGMAMSDAYLWSMTQYKSFMDQESSEEKKKTLGWDELEKSIVANIADEVSVSVKGSNVEIVIEKEF